MSKPQSSGISKKRETGNQYENIVLGPQTARISYSAYKNEFSGARSVKDSYDKATKTIEVNVQPSIRKIMEIVPDSVIKQYPKSMSKYQIAVDISDQFTNMIVSGEKLSSRAEKWQKTAYNLEKTRQSYINKYGSIYAAIQAKKKKK